MLSVEQAQAELLALCAPLAAEMVSINACHGRILAQDVEALHTHPPFAASAMDGYAVHSSDVTALPTLLKLVGESVAGKRFEGVARTGEAVRIFTGAPLPADCDCVIVQEDVARNGDSISVQGKPQQPDQHIRRAGLDVARGQLMAKRGSVISPALQGFLAAGGVTEVAVASVPHIELLACGDELKLPGDMLGDDDIVATNGLILSSLLQSAGAKVRGADRIVADNLETLSHVIGQSDADIIVTIGGASVGDRDFVQAAMRAAGCDISFWKIALKPGKPMMVGRRAKQIVIGLPGNPVSAYVCAQLFVLPALRALRGYAEPLPMLSPGIAGADLPTGGDRAEYLRAQAVLVAGVWRVTPHKVQDSSMLSVLAASNALLVRPVAAQAVPAGAPVSFMLLQT